LRDRRQHQSPKCRRGPYTHNVRATDYDYDYDYDYAWDYDYDYAWDYDYDYACDYDYDRTSGENWTS
jgi:hypothetical protein